MRFYGTIGYAETYESKPGVWKERITEREYSGDLVRDMSSRRDSAQKVNDDITISNAISIVGDPFAFENFSSIKYVAFMGTAWKISSVEIQYPRLILTTGGLYNGKRPNSTP